MYKIERQQRKDDKWLTGWIGYTFALLLANGTISFFEGQNIEIYIWISNLVIFILGVMLLTRQKFGKTDNFDFLIYHVAGLILFSPVLIPIGLITWFSWWAVQSSSIWQGIVLSILAALFGLATLGGLSFTFESRVKKSPDKYKNFVKENSLLLAELKKLNMKYDFYKYDESTLYTYPLIKFCDTYAQYKRLTTLDLFKEFIEINILKISDVTKHVNNNIKLNEQYLKEFNGVLLDCSNRLTTTNLKGKHIYKNEFNELSKSLKPKKFREIEETLCLEVKLNPQTTINVTCELRYMSPTGRNSYSDKYSYTLTDLENWYRIVLSTQTEKYKRLTEISYERSRMTNSLRYDILKRDGYRCKICGSKSCDDVKLHIDHIIPVSKGGTTDRENLQTLCDRCNSGKSNKYDFETARDFDFDDIEDFLDDGNLEDLV